MNNKIKRILRIAAPVVLCFALVFTMAAPASAAVDYNDFISNLKVDGDNDLVTVTFPGSFSNWSVSQNGSEIYNGTSASFSGVPINGLTGLQVFSNVFYGSGRLDVTNIPDGTSVSGSYDVRINWSTPTTSAFSYRTTFVVHYLSDSGYVGSVVIDDETSSNSYPGTTGYSFAIPFSFVLDKPDSALTCYFEFQIAFLSNGNAASFISGTMSPMTMQMSISSLYRLQQQTGKTNQLLEKVEQQLDSAINGTVPDSQFPPDSGIIDDYEGKENELWDSVSGGLDDANNSFVNSSAYVANLTGTFAFVAAMCNDLWLIEPFGSLLHVSLSLGVTASILGLGYLAARSSSRSGSAGRRKKGGG